MTFVTDAPSTPPPAVPVTVPAAATTPETPVAPAATPPAAPDVPEITPTDDSAPDIAGAAHAATIRDGYRFEGPAISFGAAVVADVVYPDAAVRIPLAAMNRHGLVAGATGTGKTKTLQLMAEQLSGTWLIENHSTVGKA